MATQAIEGNIPPYVRPDQVFDFDIYHDERFEGDLHGGFKSLHEVAPDMFWTPRHGGHWMVTRFDLVTQIMKDSEHFSNKEMDVPKTESPHVMIPLNLDPPEHTPYRAILVRYFSPKVVASLEETMLGWAERLIGRVIDDGQCDFTEELGAGFPVSIFMEMMGLPLERFEEFRTVVVEFFSNIPIDRRIELQGWITAEMEKVIRERQGGSGEDLVSRLTREQIRGRPLTVDEMSSMCYLLFIAGLDTVANMLTFSFYNLARRPDLQDRLRADPDSVPDFVEESLRSFAIVNGVRTVKKDYDFNGVAFREGDMVVCSLPAASMDERKNRCPMEFDIDREDRAHVAFSIGPHVCVGNYLARAEMRVFVTEWLKRVPRFRVAEGFRPEYRAGFVMALTHLPLEWDVPAK